MLEKIVCMSNVERRYKKRPEMLALYKQTETSATCPFCEPNITNDFVARTNFWNVVLQMFPCKGSKAHLLLLPKRHIADVAQLSPEEFLDLQNAISLAGNGQHSLEDGYGLALRVKELGGITIRHLHFHLIVPKEVKTIKSAVNFGIG